MQEPEFDFRDRENQLIDPNIPDLPQASFGEDTLKRYDLNDGKLIH